MNIPVPFALHICKCTWNLATLQMSKTHGISLAMPHMYACIYDSILCVYVYMNDMYVCICEYFCMHAYMYICICVHVHTCIHAYMCICIDT